MIYYFDGLEEETEEVSDLRIYPCDLCNGWHISSHYWGKDYK